MQNKIPSELVKYNLIVNNHYEKELLINAFIDAFLSYILGSFFFSSLF